MNAKAQKFAKILEDNKITCFHVDEIKDEFNTVVFRSHMEIEGLQLPVVIILDDSIYGVIRTQVVGKGVTEANRADVVAFINHLNATYKAFKYIVTEAGEIILDICVPTTVESFEPNLLRVLIDVAIKNLNENYRAIMKKVWNEAPVNTASIAASSDVKH